MGLSFLSCHKANIKVNDWGRTNIESDATMSAVHFLLFLRNHFDGPHVSVRSQFKFRLSVLWILIDRKS
jgi:hypothetical protein